jgi:hypothetical protein
LVGILLEIYLGFKNNRSNIKMNKTKINLEYIVKFSPCQSGVDRFIKAGYKKFSGNILDFINLDKISFSDIRWVLFHKDQKILSDNLMREFALLCSLRAVEGVDIPEVTYLYNIALLQYISGEEIDSAARSAAYSAANYAAYSAAYSAARSAANYAAYSAARSAANYAAYSAAEENIQKEILVDLIENGLVICPERNAR